MVNLSKTIFVLVLLLATFSQAVAEVTAKVDRTHINEGETFRLIVDAEDGEPELSALRALFDVVGTSQNSQMSFINGRIESKKEWIITLSPKQTGNLTIPSLKVGSKQTNPIQVTVNAAGSSSNLATGQDVFIEVSASPRNPYVQSQVIYTVKLYHAVEIRDGALSEPKHEDVVIERFGNDVNYSTSVNGRAYQVTERRFALFPQKSGRLRLPATVFGGQVLSGSGGPGYDPFNRFFSQPTARPVRLRSELVTLDVKAQPAGAQGKAWLPAKNLSLSASWSSPVNQLKLGEPVTLTLRMEAEGLSGAQLPAMDISLGDNFKTYPDQPVVETLNNGHSLVGIREQKLAVIPTEMGAFQLPTLKLPWWNVLSDKQQVAQASLGKLQIDSAAPAQVTMPAVADPEPVKSSQTSTDSNLKMDMVSTKTDTYFGLSARQWSLLALIAVSGWILTVLVWIFRQKSHGQKKIATPLTKPNAGQAMKDLKYACLKNEPRKARDSLIVWGQTQWPEKTIVSLNDIQIQIKQAALANKFAELNGILYHKSANTVWDGHEFWESIAPMLDSRAANSESSRSAELPPLYQ